MTNKKKRKPATRLFLRIRTYPDSAKCHVWLIRREGPAEFAVLNGTMFASQAYDLAKRLGLPFPQVESSPFNFPRPKPSPKGIAKCAASS